jgi:prepilin-type N-terminal cleavage/methylation domain-containing protein
MRRVIQAGFTLSEVLVAMGVFSTAALSVIGLLVSNFSVQAKSDELVSATHIGESVLDEWKSRPYSELAALVGLAPVTSTEFLGTTPYECTLTAKPLDSASLNPAGDVLVVQVEVKWVEKTQLTNTGTRGQRVSQLQLQSVVTPGASL